MGFFTTTAWGSKTANSEDEDDENEEDLFSHKSSFLSIVKEQSERQKKEKEREERRRIKKEEKRKSSEKRKSDEGVDKGDNKKRRITAEEGKKLLAKAGLANVIDLSDGEDEDQGQQPPAEQQLPVRRSPRHARTHNVFSPARPRSNLTAPVDTANESEDEIEITATKTRPASPPPVPEKDLDSDPEIAEMQRKAREKARTKQPKASSPDTGATDLRSSTPEGPDPVVRILITSKIPNTNPLILCRKLSQRLREVREMWCKKQGFPDAYASKVFLLHRGRRYWDYTTVKRLGIDVDSSGNVYRVDDPYKEGVDNVHVEAVTEEMFAQITAEKAREAKAVSAMQEDEERQADEGATEEAPPPQQIRLTVKAKGKPDWKVVMTPVSSSLHIKLETLLMSPTDHVNRQDLESWEEEYEVRRRPGSIPRIRRRAHIARQTG